MRRESGRTRRLSCWKNPSHGQLKNKKEGKQEGADSRPGKKKSRWNPRERNETEKKTGHASRFAGNEETKCKEIPERPSTSKEIKGKRCEGTKPREIHQNPSRRTKIRGGSPKPN